MATAQPQLNIMKILLWNLDGDDKVLADERLDDIDYVLDEVLEKHHDNLFIFCQDKINGPKHKRLSKRMFECTNETKGHTHKESRPERSCPQGKDFEYFKNKEARIYFPVCCKNNRYVYNQTYEEIGIQVGSDFNYIHRMQACVVDGHALLVSWHGPYNDFTLADQLDCFDSLVRFVERVRKEIKCEVTIVGGDFNIPVEKLREHVNKCKDQADFPDLVIFCDYVPPPDRSDIIDYVMAWPKGRMEVCKEEVVCQTYKRTPGKRPFDHPIVMYTLQNLEPKTIEHIENEEQVVGEELLVTGIADLDLDGDKEESVLLNDAKEMDRDSKEKEKNK